MQQAWTHYHAGVRRNLASAQAGPRLLAGRDSTASSGLVGGDDAVAPEPLPHRTVLVTGSADVAVLEVRPQSHPVKARRYRVAGHRDPVQPPAGLDDVGGAVALGDAGEADLLGVACELRQRREVRHHPAL